MEKTLVVMAAGMGSRFGGLKQVAAVGPDGQAILDFSVYDAKRAGFTEVVFVIKHAIEQEFKATVGARVEKVLPVKYVFQELDKLPEGFAVPEGREKPWGTGHAILCCKDAVKNPFAVINADDFYGASAYQKISEGLEDTDNFCMVGFKLSNTVTENGYVSRGVCSVENGFLVDVDEHTKIDSECKFVREDGSVGSLSPDTVVSMNMWGFTPDIFKYLGEFFVDFMKEKGTELKSEFFLPSVVDSLIKSGEKKAKVLVAEDKWYGVTYKEDLEAVVSAIKALCDAGKYKF
ncbi:MAG: NTP transferase domain-containing protein [Clostridia bacterium]|nr:NTP transferase domain-containing protein [Clostridia bacterium]